MTTRSSFLPTNSATTLELQRQQIQEEIKRKQEQLEKLQEVEKTLAYEAGQMNQATLVTQTYLLKPLFQKPLPHQLQPHQTTDPLKQFNELLAMARLVKSGKANLALESEITQLNQTVGQTNALAEDLEKKVEEMGKLIPKMQALLKTRRNSTTLIRTMSKQ